MSRLCQAGLVTRLFIPTIDGERRDAAYTLAQPSARELARLKDNSPFCHMANQLEKLTQKQKKGWILRSLWISSLSPNFDVKVSA